MGQRQPESTKISFTITQLGIILGVMLGWGVIVGLYIAALIP